MDCRESIEMDEDRRTEVEPKEKIADDKTLEESDRETLVSDDKSNKENKEKIILEGEAIHRACTKQNKKVNEFWMTVSKKKKSTWMKPVEETLYVSYCYGEKI